MSRNVIAWAILTSTVGMMSGCGSGFVPETDPPPAQPQEKPRPRVEEKPKAPPKVVRLDVPISISLADLLKKPRQDLAQLAKDLEEQIQLQEKNHREGNKPYVLVPNFRLPLVVPIFRQANFSSRLKFSLPPYLAEGQEDTPIALHLAGFGDTEAALRLLDPADRNTFKEINKGRHQQNYPVEWTRLVGLHLHAAQIGLAAGDVDSARHLIGLHTQLVKVLDGKARSGVLGATLLGRGRTVLAQAAAAWRNEKKMDLAEQVEAVLANWGAVPPGCVPVKLGSEQAVLAAVFANSGEGHALRPSNTLRAFDLLGLPFPEEAADAVIAVYDADARLAELLVTYRPQITAIYPETADLAYLVEESGIKGQDLAMSGMLHRRSYRFGAYVWEVTVIPHNTAAGAMVRLGSAKPLFNSPTLPRDFQIVHLDRSFEQNRRHFAINQRGNLLTVDGAKALARIFNPVPALQLIEATLERDPGQDVVKGSALTYAAEPRGLPALARIALPLWTKWGPARIEGETTSTRSLILIWEDARTQISLRLPHDKSEPPVLEVRDRTPAQGIAQRAAQVAAQDLAERAARFNEKKILTRIVRVREGIRLGMSRAEVLEELPSGDGIVPRDIPDGVGIIYKGDPEENPGYIARELFVRFGPDKRVAEVRVRYVDASGTKEKAGLRKLLRDVAKRCGAPQEVPGPWTKVWTAPFARRKPAPVLYRWQDDVTLLTCQRDSEGVELAVRDCPLDQQAGIPLGPFRYLPAGPDKCKLGMTKADLLNQWKQSQPEFQQGLLILSPPKDSPYDQVFVTFNKEDGAVLITARHKTKFDGKGTAAQWAAAVQEGWAADVCELGWPRREDLTRRRQLQSWTSHDDVTRLSIFWQERKSGSAQVFSEWKRLEPPGTR